MSEFKSLYSALKGWYCRPWAELPDTLREMVDGPGGNFIISWGSLTPAQRIYRAKEWDYQHDPATKAQRDELHKFYDDYEKLKCEIAYWENANAPTVLDMAKREEILAPLKAQFDAMDLKRRQMLGDSDADDETIAQGIGEQDGNQSTEQPSGTKQDALAVELNEILQEMEQKNERITATVVFAKLKKSAGNGGCVVDVSGDGSSLQWERNNGTTESLDIDKLQKRIDRWKNKTPAKHPPIPLTICSKFNRVKRKQSGSQRGKPGNFSRIP
ncbi:MAG: hypothetical protein Q8O38_16850 [Sulfurimicrobium sp.]|nr:hypothetical protein [Sulfurimicrobium sp.]